DRNNLYALPEFLSCCSVYGLTPVIAAELTGNGGDALLYAEADQGFSNLCRIISEYHCNKNFNLVFSISAGTDGIHVVCDNLSLIDSLKKLLPVYYRMRRPKTPPSSVRKAGIPCIIAPPMVFTANIDFQTHRLLRAIDNNTTLSRLPEAETFPEDACFLPWHKLCERFEVFDYAIESTEQFCTTICSRKSFGKAIMPGFSCENSSRDYLRSKAFEGAKRRYGELSDEVVSKLNYELGLIEKKGFSDYFLVVDDIVRQSPRTCGRGSGAASIVAFSLGITNVDPIRYNLMFERFLNPGRVDPPDIDVDFAWDERDEVLDYVFDKYGNEHAAMVATHLTCGARMAIREIARIYGLTEEEISRVTAKIPYFVELGEYAQSLMDVLKQWPAMKGVILDPPWPEILEKAGRIIGMPRGIGTHCGGVVITPQPINTVAPVQYSAKGYPIVQWEKDGAEEMGLVKIDLLGNRSLAVIRDAIANIKSEGISFDEKHWDPQSDPATLELFKKGDSIGVFYVESPAMRLLQKKSGTGDFEHLVIHSSIIRPAANKYIREYLKRLHGESWTVLHPKLNETLSETFGIMVYQEDVSKVAMALADFSVEDADMLRKIMSKKTKSAKFEDFRKLFFDGASKNSVSEAVIQEIWEMMLSFSGYSFCKPHSASYVQVSFQSGYLKAHFGAAFMAAVLSNYGGYYSTQAYISEAMRMGIKIIPPDVNRSHYRYYSRENCIIVGFCQIKGLSNNAQEQIVKNRSENGLFYSMDELLSRSGITESDAEKLILAGACDCFASGSARPQLFWQMRRFFRSSGSQTIPELNSLSARQFLQYQYKTLGFLTVCHPLTLMNFTCKMNLKARDIDKFIGRQVTIPAWCITAKTVTTKLGTTMEFVTFEDETGLIETVFFPQIYARYASILQYHTAFLVTGLVTEEFGVATLEVEKLERH
ncbi:MAG TPA: DNA polymerase III subunit alpha, partial [Chitinispirillaceae bacterium]|nr:DNA polymerase III subunit alpha [Chitinispirillaceae bacterium]